MNRGKWSYFNTCFRQNSIQSDIYYQSNIKFKEQVKQKSKSTWYISDLEQERNPAEIKNWLYNYNKEKAIRPWE